MQIIVLKNGKLSSEESDNSSVYIYDNEDRLLYKRDFKGKDIIGTLVCKYNDQNDKCTTQMLNYYPKDYAYASGLKEGDSGVLDEIVFYKDSNGKVNKYQFQKDSKYLNFTDATDLYQKEFAQNSKTNSEDEYNVVKIMLDDFNNIDMGDDEGIEPTIENTETSNLDLKDNQSETEIHEPIANSETSNAIEERESNKSNVSSEESNYNVQKNVSETNEETVEKIIETPVEEKEEIDEEALAKEYINKVDIQIFDVDDVKAHSVYYDVDAILWIEPKIDYKIEKAIVTNQQTGDSLEISDLHIASRDFESCAGLDLAPGDNTITFVFYDNYGNTRQKTIVENKYSD